MSESSNSLLVCHIFQCGHRLPTAQRSYSVSLPQILRSCLALPCLSVEVRSGGRLNGSLVFGKVRGLSEWFFNELLLAQDAADRLVVGILRELEEESVIDGRLGFLVGLCIVRPGHRCIFG